jgi:hypothetical protein
MSTFDELLAFVDTDDLHYLVHSGKASRMLECVQFYNGTLAFNNVISRRDRTSCNFAWPSDCGTQWYQRSTVNGP